LPNNFFWSGFCLLNFKNCTLANNVIFLDFFIVIPWVLQSSSFLFKQIHYNYTLSLVSLFKPFHCLSRVYIFVKFKAALADHIVLTAPPRVACRRRHTEYGSQLIKLTCCLGWLDRVWGVHQSALHHFQRQPRWEIAL